MDAELGDMLLILGLTCPLEIFVRPDEELEVNQFI